MEKCRLCLGNKKNLRCIFDVQENHSYADMVTSISNIKILKDDGITDKICLGCRRKLKDLFDFKLTIEMSAAALQNSSNCKKICFNNLEDTKILFGHDKYVPKIENNIYDYFKDGDSSVVYNGITITKMEPYDVDIKYEKGPLSVLDFLNTIKDEPEHDFNDDGDIDYEPFPDDIDDDEECLPLSVRMKLIKKKAKKISKTRATNPERKKYNYKEKLKSVPQPIKPVFLSDVRVLRTKLNNKSDNKVTKKYKNRTKKEMCYHCGKMSTSLKQHLLTHTGDRSFKCEICGKGFFTSRDLLYHAKKRHIEASARTFKCELCVANFGTKEAIQSHMISHSNEKNHVCNICSKPFKRRAALRRHELSHNITNKNIKCELCNMSFFHNYGLNHHMRVHTGERPYNCELCSQPYSYKHDFNRHCLKKHGVFLKRRSVNVMNEEVLKRERALMKDLMLKVHGFVNDGENINPFEGPQGAQAFELAVKALKSKQIPIDFNI